MLIHSVTPPHLLTPPCEYPAAAHKQLGNSYLEGRETPQGFQVSRILSTDPAMYLRDDISPGSIHKINE